MAFLTERANGLHPFQCTCVAYIAKVSLSENILTSLILALLENAPRVQMPRRCPGQAHVGHSAADRAENTHRGGHTRPH